MPSKLDCVNAQRPPCPMCDMHMIGLDGFKLDPEHRTFECLRYEHVKRPKKPISRTACRTRARKIETPFPTIKEAKKTANKKMADKQ